MKQSTKLLNDYTYLLIEIENATSRSEAIELIHRLEKLRQELTQLDQQHPVTH